MEARPHSWWQQVRKLLEVFGIIVVCMLMLALLAVIILAYIYNVNVPGLRGKTLWDWLQLLIIPLMLAIGGFWFNQIQKSRDKRATEQRDKTERAIAADNQREVTLQAYLDKMSELLLEKRLRDSAKEDEIRKIARVRTLTVLRGLDPIRKAGVIQFLHEASLIDKDKCIISLDGADLSGANLSRAYLGGVDLSNVNLARADLHEAYLGRADPNKAYFRKVVHHGDKAALTYRILEKAARDLGRADLRDADQSRANLFGAGANLSGANLSGADLSGADLSEASLSFADLSEANLSGAILFGAHLSGADLSEASLSFADLDGADLSGADLSGADLSEALLFAADAMFLETEELEKQVKSLKGATLPDGSIHP